MTANWTFEVTGMHCASCGMLIDEALEDTAGVLKSATSLRKGRTVVQVDADQCTPEAVLAVIATAGYQAVHRG